MHRVDVEAMLASMTSHQLLRWNVYHELKARRLKEEADNPPSPPTVVR